MSPAERGELDLTWARKAHHDFRAAVWNLTPEQIADALADVRVGQSRGALARFLRWLGEIDAIPASYLEPEPSGELEPV